MAPNNYEVDTFISSWAPTAALCEEPLKLYEASGVLLCYRTPEEHQKERQKRTQKEKNTSPPSKLKSNITI